MTANSHIRVIGAGFLPVALRLPAAVAVDQLRQVGRLLGVSGDELVLQKFFGRWPLWTRSGQTDRADGLLFTGDVIAPAFGIRCG